MYLETTRLVCLQDKGFCRYYVGIRGSQKPCEWAYFSTKTLKLLEEYAGERVNRSSVRKYTKRNGLLPPKYIRKATWRLMIKAMPREVARFIQSRFGELRVSEARYKDLLSEADEYYPKYLTVAVLGFIYGSTLALFPAATGDFFGLKYLSENYALLFTSWGVSGLLFPSIGGYIKDLTGGYESALVLSSLLSVAGAAIGLYLKKRLALYLH